MNTKAQAGLSAHDLKRRDDKERAVSLLFLLLSPKIPPATLTAAANLLGGQRAKLQAFWERDVLELYLCKVTLQSFKQQISYRFYQLIASLEEISCLSFCREKSAQKLEAESAEKLAAEQILNNTFPPRSQQYVMDFFKK